MTLEEELARKIADGPFPFAYQPNEPYTPPPVRITVTPPQPTGTESMGGLAAPAVDNVPPNIQPPATIPRGDVPQIPDAPPGQDIVSQTFRQYARPYPNVPISDLQAQQFKLGIGTTGAKDEERTPSALDLTPMGALAQIYDATRENDPASFALGGASLLPGGAIGKAIMLGPGAIGLQTKAAKQALARAKQMRKAGAAPGEIKAETGWEFDIKNKPQFEVSDVNAEWRGIPPQMDYQKIALQKFKEITGLVEPEKYFGKSALYEKQSKRAMDDTIDQIAKEPTVPLSSVLHHPDAYALDPRLGEMRYRALDPRYGEKALGSYLPPRFKGDQPIIETQAFPPGRGKGLGVVLHEAGGHGISQLEGFSSGGNPWNFKNANARALYRARMSELTTPPSFDDFVKSAQMSMPDGSAVPREQLLAAYLRYADKYKARASDPSFRKDVRKWAAIEAYRRSVGENQANAFMKRKDLPQEELRTRLLETDEAVPRSEQLYTPQKKLPDLDPPKDITDISPQMSALTDPAGYKAPYPQYAEKYPKPGPPVLKLKDNPSFKGETYEAKELTPQAKAFMKARTKIQKEMDEDGFEPYFDPAKRSHVDPSKYPGRNVDTLKVMPKTEAKQIEYREFIDTPETRKLLMDAYKKGSALGNAHDWYAMAQLEKEYIKEYGAKEGRKQFLEGFAVPMAATTSGNNPQANYLLAHYFEFMRGKGKALPEGHQFPAPIGGRRGEINKRDYEATMSRGGYSGLGENQPKMHNFSRSFIGDLDRAVMDEQMATGMLAPQGISKVDIDKARRKAFGMLEKPVHDFAKKLRIAPGNFQDVAWAGFKGESAGPMIDVINEAIERTHRLTGMARDEIVRRGIVRREIPVYGLIGAVGAGAMGSLADQGDYQ